MFLAVTLRPLLARVQFLAEGDQARQPVLAAHFEAAGAGVPAARALRVLGGAVTVLAPGTGEVARCYARRLQDETIGAHLVETAAPMPMSVLHHWWDSRGGRYRRAFVEEPARLSRGEMRRFVAELEALLPEARAVVLAGGEVPPGGEFLLSEIAARARKAGRIVICAAGVASIAEAVQRGQGCLVAARDELGHALIECEGDEPAVVSRALGNGIDTLLLVGASGPASLHVHEATVVLEPPEAADRGGEGAIEAVAAGLAVRLAAGWDAVSAASYGLAAGLAQRQKELGGSLSAGEVDGFFARVRRRP